MEKEYESLNEKINQLKESCIKCMAEKDVHISNLHKNIGNLERDMTDIKHSLQKLNDEVKGLTLRISTAISVVLIFVQVVLPYLKKIL